MENELIYVIYIQHGEDSIFCCIVMERNLKCERNLILKMNSHANKTRLETARI